MHKHKMGLSPSQMVEMREERKTIELRLYDEKCRELQIGDIIVFTNTRNNNDILQVRIKNIHTFKSFKELYKSLPISKLGYTQKDIATASYKDMYKHYSKEDIQKYGVIGIEVTTEL